MIAQTIEEWAIMVFVKIDLIPWLNSELLNRGWSQRELARRAEIAQSSISDVLAYKRLPTWDFCAGIARALGVPIDEVFILAGLKPAPPTPVPEEGEAIALLRDLPTTERSVVIKQLRGLAGQPPPTPVGPVDLPRLQLIVERLNRLPRERQEHTIDTILMLLEIAEAGPSENEKIEILSGITHSDAGSDPRA